MRKGFCIILAAALLAVFALPAMAEVNLSGFIRTKGYVSNYERFDAGTFIPFGAATGGDTGATFAAPALFTKRLLLINTENTSHYVEERGRLKFEAKGENVGAVAFFEIDMRWGDVGYGSGRNQGGGLEGDTINLETKNLYVWFKPNADTTVTVGLQGFTDAYHGIIFGAADMAGIFVTGKLAPVDYRLGWAKLAAGNGAGGAGAGTVAEDKDVDFYALEAHFAPTKEMRVGGNFYYIRDSQNTSLGGATIGPPINVTIPGVPGLQKIDSYYIGLDGSFKLDPITLSAFALYNFGTIDFDETITPGGDTDIKAWAADVRADAAVGPGKGFIEAIYVSGTGSGDSDWKTLVTGSTWQLAASFFYTTDMQILLPNIDDINSSEALAYEVSNLGSGIIHVGAGYTMPLVEKLTGKVGVGYLRAAKDFVNSDKSQATEVNATLTYNLAKGLDLSGVGAIAFLGNYYDGLDAKDPYKLVGRLNYSF